MEKKVIGTKYGVNVRCLKDVDFSRLTYREVDKASV